MFAPLAVLLMFFGFAVTAFFCVRPRGDSAAKGAGKDGSAAPSAGGSAIGSLVLDFVLGAVASALLAGGTLFVFLYAGIYV